MSRIRSLPAAAIWLLLGGAAMAQTVLVDPGTPAFDWLTLLKSVPGIGPYLPYIPVLIAVATALASALPAPTVTHGVYYYLYQIINTIAFNFGHGKNLSAPESKGIVGGPSAISAPLLATAVVPLATATQAEKAVTVMPDATPVAGQPAPQAAAVIAGNQAAAAFDAQKAAAPAPAKPAGLMP